MFPSPKKTGVDQAFLLEFLRRPSLRLKYQAPKSFQDPKILDQLLDFRKRKIPNGKKCQKSWIQRPAHTVMGPNKETDPGSKLPSHFISSGINFSGRTRIRGQWERVSHSKIRARLSQILRQNKQRSPLAFLQLVQCVEHWCRRPGNYVG